MEICIGELIGIFVHFTRDRLPCVKKLQRIFKSKTTNEQCLLIKVLRKDAKTATTSRTFRSFSV